MFKKPKSAPKELKKNGEKKQTKSNTCTTFTGDW